MKGKTGMQRRKKTKRDAPAQEAYELTVYTRQARCWRKSKVNIGEGTPPLSYSVHSSGGRNCGQCLPIMMLIFRPRDPWTGMRLRPDVGNSRGFHGLVSTKARTLGRSKKYNIQGILKGLADDVNASLWRSDVVQKVLNDDDRGLFSKMHPWRVTSWYIVKPFPGHFSTVFESYHTRYTCTS